MLKLYNTLSKKVEEFTPIHPPKVGLYTCGMTVYDFAHIGHGKKYVGDDILRRVLTRCGFDVTHVQNVTDVGHLSSDGDSGEDKIEKGAVKSGKTVWEVAEFYTKHFYDSMDKLNVLRPTITCKATDHIKDQIALIQTLVTKGYAYDTPEAVYFDVSKFKNYGKLFGQNLDEKKTAVREEVQTGKLKKHPADFALWFKRAGRFADHAMHWDSPWGDGFPGWHIECSAMSMKYLGDTVDIHTGGIDHIPIHHPNEIAQSEAATGKQFVRYWVHHAFLMVDGKKMSKSLGNVYTIEDVIKKGFDPIALRYFYLTAHYRREINFTWDSMHAAQNALNELRGRVSQLAGDNNSSLSNEGRAMKQVFDHGLQSDLNTSVGLRVLWDVLKSDLPDGEKKTLVADFNQTLGLELDTVRARDEKIPPDITALVAKREQFRKEKNYAQSDAVRKQIEDKGFVIEDAPNGIRVKNKK